MLVLDALRPTYTESGGNFVPDFPVMEGPPLPATVLAAEAADDLLPTRMRTDVLGYV